MPGERTDGRTDPPEDGGSTAPPEDRGADRSRRRSRRWPLFLAGFAVSLAGAFVAMVLVGSLIDPLDERSKRAGGKRSTSTATPANRLLATIDESTTKGAAPADRRLKPYEHLVATAKRSGKGVPVFARPGAKEPEQRVERREAQTGDLVFAGIRQQGRWVKVLLPVRPNGSTGWVRERDVTLTVTDWSAKIDLSDHVISVRHKGETFKEWEIGLGQPETPTPPGEYYITELIEPKRPDTIYGAYVFVLSGYSEKLTRYAGGNGELGLHGTNDPSGLGFDVSHGCIRLRNAAITKLTQRLPLGTPLEIVK